MSEKMYRLLLRLYPSRFRGQYGEEAMQVFRDRLRDERGAWKRARLWMDVLRDLATSAPREHRRAPARPAASVSGVPSFLVLEEQPLRPDMFLLGTVLALVAVGTFVYLMTHGGNRVVFPSRFTGNLQSAMAPAIGGNGEQATPKDKDEAEPVPLVTAEERELVIQSVTGAVAKYDPDRVEARSVAGMLEEQRSAGAYDDIRSGPEFAGILTRELSGATRFVTVTVICGYEPAADSSMWMVPAGPGQRAWLRIDEHFSVTVTPVGQAEGNRQ